MNATVAASLVDAIAARDTAPLATLLSDDVVLHSPVLTKPFVGRKAALDVYASLFEIFDELSILDRFTIDCGEGFRWSANINGSEIEGVDFLRTDPSDRVSEVRVFIRPLPDIATFAAALGPVLARRTSRPRSRLIAVAAWPLGPLLRFVDRIAAWLTQTR